LAIWRVIELKRAIAIGDQAGADVRIWEARLEEIEADIDPLDELLAEIESGTIETEGHKTAADSHSMHRVRLNDGRECVGSYVDIVVQLKEACGDPGESVAQFMRRHAAEERLRSGVELPDEDPENFILTGARAGLWELDP
jgi:hypothetical protein